MSLFVGAGRRMPATEEEPLLLRASREVAGMVVEMRVPFEGRAGTVVGREGAEVVLDEPVRRASASF